MTSLHRVACLAAALLIPGLASGQSRVGESFAALTPSSVIDGFRAQAVYLDAVGKPIGARFLHEKSGFTLDIVQQQSVPQAHIWVRTFALTDKGEPHTQEHLLVGKGAKGRALATIESSSLATSTAFTEQWRTDYPFNTSAGPRVFYDLVETELDALLNPDFTDEEIRREVRNFGVSEDPTTKALRLEEKGSVYNEMTSSTSTAAGHLYIEAARLIYGSDHPFSHVSGGTPEGIRALTAEDIRAFHRSHYYLANMGMIVAMPSSMPLSDALRHIGATLVKLDRAPAATSPISTLDQVPAPQPAPEGTIRIVGFPHQNPQQPADILFVWPATRRLSVNEQTLLSLFLDATVGDPTTNLYKIFVDAKTRTSDIGARGVYSFLPVPEEPGNPVYIGLSDVEPRHMNETEIAAARAAVLAEFRRIAALPDGSPELVEFNARVKSRILSARRNLSKFVNSPPGFGFRNTYSDWLEQVELVNRTDGFRKSLVLTPAMHFADSIASSPTNAWRTFLPAWQLTTTTPFAIAAKADPSMIAAEDSARRARASAEVARLRAQYGTSDDQQTIARYRAAYDSNSAVLDRLAATDAKARLVDDLPMTLDDQLQYQTVSVRGVPVVSSTFESMTSMTAGLALRTDPVEDDELVYLSALPSLLTRVGIVKNGTPMTYEAMSEKQRQEILSLTAGFSTNMKTDRVELVLRGAGNDATEAVRAIGWMRDVLTAPNWTTGNLPRLRDLVDQMLAGARNTQQGSPEAWVQGVANSYRKQDNPRYLAATSFLTDQHFYLRLKWLLRDTGVPADRDALDAWLKELAAGVAPQSRASAQWMLKVAADTTVTTSTLPGREAQAFVDHTRALPPAARKTAAELARDIEQTLTDMPDATLAGDWTYVVNQLREDLLTPPDVALARLNAVRAKLLTTGNARAFVISSSSTRRAIAPALGQLLGTLRIAPATKAVASGHRLIDERLMRRAGGAKVYVGLLDQNMQGGVMMNSVPTATYADTSARLLTRFLAGRIYGGGGAHSAFSQTIAAGLAYSNGIGSSPTSGRLSYYAERTPELPQTLGFVVGQLKKSPHDTSLVDYAMALVFSETRAANSFESRGESMANDLADGLSPASVRRFRQRLLTLRRTTPSFGAKLYTQMDSVYAELLPGYTRGLMGVPGGVYFTIGSDKQQDAYEKYLAANVGSEAKLFRLYARDFWIPTATRRVVP